MVCRGIYEDRAGPRNSFLTRAAEIARVLIVRFISASRNEREEFRAVPPGAFGERRGIDVYVDLEDHGQLVEPSFDCPGERWRDNEEIELLVGEDTGAVLDGHLDRKGAGQGDDPVRPEHAVEEEAGRRRVRRGAHGFRHLLHNPYACRTLRRQGASGFR